MSSTTTHQLFKLAIALCPVWIVTHLSPFSTLGYSALVIGQTPTSMYGPQTTPGGAEGEWPDRSRSDRYQYAEDGWPVAAAEAAGEREAGLDHYRLGLWRHGQYPCRHEPRRI